jgi:uncharacterized protein YerC
VQISKQKVNKILENQLQQMWYQMVADIKNPREAREIFSNLLSETELTTVIKRLATGYWLTKKRSYEVIRDNLKVSSASIASIQKDLKNPGWQIAIKKILAEEWATKWEEKIKSLLKVRRYEAKRNSKRS